MLGEYNYSEILQFSYDAKGVIYLLKSSSDKQRA
ncbi:hypothetical protein PLUTE_b6011 [Pseudoalteromonas luteoviolacea DSM 6061]|nr:hypothetical protein [Pseudoalteromonas luteoviolacea DSM 6061]